MRCPKCGFVSFDNVDTCLKCKKDISEISSAFQGTTFNVSAPSFLKFSDPDDENEASLDGEDVDGAVEFADPDLEILVEEGDEDEDGEINFSMDEDEEEDLSEEDAALAKEFGVMDTIDDQDAPADSDGTLDLGMFEDGSEEDVFSFDEEKSDSAGEVSLELPDELNDISDLSPPESISDEETLSFEEEPAETPVAEPEPDVEEPEEELDFGSLDMDLSFDDDEPEDDFAEPAVKGAATAKAPAKSVAGMDDDLDLDLDLGGLSIHDK